MPTRLSRRQFLKGATATLSAFALPTGLAGRARAAGTDPVLVVVYLRGGADGLNLVIPAGDPDYYTLRPGIQIPAGQELPIDGFFGLHPAFGSLLPLYQDGELAFLHAAGSPDGSRSHFDAQDYMERAAPGDPGVTDGWLNRYLGIVGRGQSWSGITLGSAEVLALQGASPSLSFTSIGDFVLDDATLRNGVIAAMYDEAPSAPLRAAGTAAFDALGVIGGVDPTSNVVYAPGSLGPALADTAALVRADIGVRLVAIDLGGWDHHSGEEERLAPLAGQLASGLATFRDDLGTDWSRTAVLVMTEFGRTAAENGSAGTDHGHGTFMACTGGRVAGGRVVMKNDAWPGLGPSQLFEGRDLAVTTDFRDVFADVLHSHMGTPLASLAPVLPGHTISAANLPGLFA